jgi:prepilin-type N-terminal cleavage/methylation domain-containing protein
MRRHGFTLIELLVVVSIIALLIAILLPSLVRAREQATRVVCGARVHQLAIGVSAYVLESKGALPTLMSTGGYPFVTYWINNPTAANPVRRVNLGLLLNFIPDPQSFYCPSVNADETHSLSFNGPDNAWNDSLGDSQHRVRSSYPARAYHAVKSVTGDYSWKLADFSNKVIYSDFYMVDNWQGGGIIKGYINAPHQTEGYNRMFGDGSNRWINAAPLAALRPINSVTPVTIEVIQYYEVLDREP